MKQEYVIKKFVRAKSAEEALLLDKSTPVSEVFLATEKPVDRTADAIGFCIDLVQDGSFDARSRMS